MPIEKHMLQTHSLFEKAGEVLEGVVKLKERIAELETRLSAIQSEKMQLEDDNALLRQNNAELRKENESLKYSVATLDNDLAMATRWRKVSEELPEEGVEVLVTNGVDCAVTDWCGDYWNNDPFCGYTISDNVIAWMPLPKIPEVK